MVLLYIRLRGSWARVGLVRCLLVDESLVALIEQWVLVHWRYYLICTLFCLSRSCRSGGICKRFIMSGYYLVFFLNKSASDITFVNRLLSNSSTGTVKAVIMALLMNGKFTGSSRYHL